MEHDCTTLSTLNSLFWLRQTIALELGTVGSPQHVERESRAESARLELLGVPWAAGDDEGWEPMVILYVIVMIIMAIDLICLVIVMMPVMVRVTVTA